MENVHCGSCRRKLGEADFVGLIVIKCPRCGALNNIQRAARPQPERQRASEREQPSCKVQEPTFPSR